MLVIPLVPSDLSPSPSPIVFASNQSIDSPSLIRWVSRVG